MKPMTARSILSRTEARRRRRRALTTAIIALCTVPAMNGCSDDREEVLASTSQALSGDGLVISQLSVFGSSDSNNGSKYSRNFVELFNRSHVPISLDGLSVQTAGFSANFANSGVALPNVSIVPGGYFLIAFGVKGTVGVDLPAADLDASITLSGTPAWGKIAIARSQDALGCGAASNRCAAEKVVDMLGWNSSDYEGAPFKGTLRPYALFRNGDGCTDTNNNAADFSLASPVPRNSSSPADVCPNEDLNDAGADAPSDASDGSIDGATTDAGLSDASSDASVGHSSDASADGGTLDAGGDASIADASHDAPADGAVADSGGDPSSDGGVESPGRDATLPDSSGKGASPTAEDAAENLSGDDSGCSSSGRTVASRHGTALLGLGLLVAAIVRRRRPCCANT